LSATTTLANIAPVSVLRRLLPAHALVLFLLQYSEKKENIYNLLWVVVFGFATLNILGLVARRLEPSRSRMSFGEILAVAVVVIAVILLGWEMLYLFRILPIKLEPR
jgi:hypothetical protein